MREQRTPSIPVPFSRQASLDGAQASPGSFLAPVKAPNVGDRLSATRSTSSSHWPGPRQQGRLGAHVLLRRWSTASGDPGDEPRPLSPAVAAAAAAGLPPPRRGDSSSDTDHSCSLEPSQRTVRSLQVGRNPPPCGQSGGLRSSWGTVVESEPAESESETAVTAVAAVAISREPPLLCRTDGGRLFSDGSHLTAPAHGARGSRHTTHRPHFLTGAGTPQKSAGILTAPHLSGSDSSSCGEGADSNRRQHSAGGHHSFRGASFAALPPQHLRRSDSYARAAPASRRSVHSSAKPQAITGGASAAAVQRGSRRVMASRWPLQPCCTLVGGDSAQTGGRALAWSE